jgi:hypothetical protein
MSPSKLVLLSLCLCAGACGDDGGGDGGNASDARPSTPDATSNGPDAMATGPDAMPGTPDSGPLPDAAVPSEVVINEAVLDNAGNDNNEFAELKGLPNTDYTGLTLLEIDGDDDGGVSLNPGVVVSIHAGCVTDANGYCEIAVANNTFDNGSQTLLLVEGGTYVVGTTDIDASNDGVIDNEPWTTLLDGVAIVNAGTDFGYAGNVVLMKTVGGNQDDPVTFGGASRIPDGTDTDAAADWTSNTPNFNNAGIASGEARNTPGVANTVEP